MQKIMQKHGKWILAVVGAFLMLTFTLPNVLTHNSNPASYEIGRLNGKKVVAAQEMSANNEIKILATFGLLQSNPYKPSSTVGVLNLDPSGYTAVPVAFLYSSSHDTERGTHWFLLLQEARKYGIVASEAEVTQVIASTGLNKEQLEKQLTDMGITYRDLQTAVEHGLQIRNLALMAMRSADVSVPELEYLASETLSKVQVDYTALDVAGKWPKAAEPSADAIQKQFNLYKDVIAAPPGSTTPPPTIDGHTYPFGYKYPDRVKVQYLKFDREILNARFKPTQEDYVEAYHYYTEHPDEFRAAPAYGPNPTTQPAVKPFEQVQDELVKKQVDDRVDKFMKRVTDRVTALLADPWKNTKETEGGYRETLPREQWASYQSVVDAIKSSREFNGYAPQYGEVDHWADEQQLAEVPGIGNAYYENQMGRYKFPEMAVHVKELGESKSLPKLFFQVGVEGPILKDDQGNLYMYRVTEVDKSHDPKSVEEVRSQVVADLKKLETYEQQQKLAKELAAEAAKGSLARVAQRQGLSVKTTPEMNHLQKQIPQLGNVPGFMDAAFAMARRGSSTQPATQSAGTTPTTTVSDDSTLTTYVLSLAKFTPVKPADFAQERPFMINLLLIRKGGSFVDGWLSLEALAKRLNYVPATPFAKEEAENPMMG